MGHPHFSRRCQGALPEILLGAGQGSSVVRTGVARETSVISEKLTKMNELGSSPSTRSLPSTVLAVTTRSTAGDQERYVYQKATSNSSCRQKTSTP